MFTYNSLVIAVLSTKNVLTAKLTNDAPPNKISHCTHISGRENAIPLWLGVETCHCSTGGHTRVWALEFLMIIRLPTFDTTPFTRHYTVGLPDD